MSKKIKKEVSKKSKKDELEEEEEDEETIEDNDDADGDDNEDDDSDSDEDEEDEDSDDDGESSSKKIDYKAIAEKEKKRREDAEALIAADKFKKKHKGGKDNDEDDSEDDGDDDDKPLTRGELKRFMTSQNKQSQRQLYGDRIKEIAFSIAESEDEANAIIEVHANRTYPESLSIREQLEEAQAGINRQASKSKLSEMKRAAMSKGSFSKGGENTFKDGQQGSAPKMSKADESAYKSAGFKYDTKNRVFKKKLPNGKHLVKDPRTKKSWVI